MDTEKTWLRDLERLLDRLFARGPHEFARACAGIDDAAALRQALAASPALPGYEWRLGRETVTVRRPNAEGGPSVLSLNTETGTANRLSYENGALSRHEGAALGHNTLQVAYMRGGEPLPIREHALPTQAGAVDFGAMLRETVDPLAIPKGQRVPPGVEPDIRHTLDRNGEMVPIAHVEGRECPWERIVAYPDRIEAGLDDALKQYEDLAAAAEDAARTAQAAGRIADYKRLDDLRSEASRTHTALIRLKGAGVERVSFDTGGVQEPLAFVSAARTGIEELSRRVGAAPTPR